MRLQKTCNPAEKINIRWERCKVKTESGYYDFSDVKNLIIRQQIVEAMKFVLNVMVNIELPNVMKAN